MQKIVAFITVSLLTCSAGDLSWMYKADPLTAGKSHSAKNPYLHDCNRPIKPSNLEENRNIRAYNTARREFTECINEHNNKNVKLYNASRDKKQREQLKEAIQEAHNDWEEYINGKRPTKQSDSGVHAKTGSNVHTVGYSDPTTLYKDIKF